MTDHPTPATPEATEREAREVMERTLMRYAEIEHPNRDHPALTWKFERDVEADRADLDAYRAAVAAVEYERGRRAERERIAGIVEGMVGYDVRTEADEFSGRDGIETVDRDALLAKLREGA